MYRAGTFTGHANTQKAAQEALKYIFSRFIDYGPIFSYYAYPYLRDHKNTQMEIFAVYASDKFLFFQFMH